MLAELRKSLKKARGYVRGYTKIQLFKKIDCQELRRLKKPLYY